MSSQQDAQLIYYHYIERGMCLSSLRSVNDMSDMIIASQPKKLE